jgi:hypothetical protein
MTDKTEEQLSEIIRLLKQLISEVQNVESRQL